MEELEDLAADLELHAVAVRLVGVAVLRRPRQVGQPELPLVDHAVVARGELVAVEPGRDRFVGDHVRRLPPVGAGFLLVEVDAEHVIDVAVGEDGRIEPRVRPAAHGLVHRLGVEHAAGVDRNEPGLGLDHGRVGERVDEGDLGLHFGELTARCEGVMRLDRELAGEQLVGEVEHIRSLVGHGGQSRAGSRPCALPRESKRVLISR